MILVDRIGGTSLRRAALLLIGALLIACSLSGADSESLSFCGAAKLSSEDILSGRYPDPETLLLPELCKVKARQLLQKWKQQDANDLEMLAAEACAETSKSYEHWILEKGLKKLDRETEMFDLSCACSGELLSKATNPPAPPSGVALVTEIAPAAQAEKGATSGVPVHYSAQVTARKAITGMIRNATELVKILSGTTAVTSNLFEVVLSGQWKNVYKDALRATFAEASKIEQFSIALDQAGAAGAAAASQSTALASSRRALMQQASVLTEAYVGIANERELPRGQCYEVFGIRHQILLRALQQLADPGSGK